MILRLSSSLFLFALSTLAFANDAPATLTSPAKFYLGALAGGGSSTHFNASQFGSAFFPEVSGGPLAVNAFGQLSHKKIEFLGVQLGYQGQQIVLNSASQWTLRPAAELEGYAMNKRSFKGTLVNDTTRIDEHDFLVSYPIRNTVFLANAVLNFNHADSALHPYIGFGIGNAIIRNTDASAEQANPPEVGINHYNVNTSDTSSTFAGQIKLGLGYDVRKCISLFAEYRWLYLASTDFVFGSTVYPGHVATSSWQVNLGSQTYHLGNIGVRFSW